MEKKDSDDIDHDVITKGKTHRRERRPDDSSNDDRKADSKTDGPVDNKKAGRRRLNVASEDNKTSSNNNSGGGGWMTSGGSGNDMNKNNMISIQADDDDNKDLQTTSKVNKEKHFQDDNDEIVLIPDLDEDGGGDTDRIAHAPRNINRKIPTLHELEKEMKAAVPASVDGYNLTVLLATLVPSSMVSETDTLWTFESLLREITDEISQTPKTVISTPTTSDTTTTITNNNNNMVSNMNNSMQSLPKHNKTDTSAVNSKHDKK